MLEEFEAGLPGLVAREERPAPQQVLPGLVPLGLACVVKAEGELQAARPGPKIRIVGLGPEKGVDHPEGGFEVAVLEVFLELRQAGPGDPAGQAEAGLFQQLGARRVAWTQAEQGLGPAVGAQGIRGQGGHGFLADGFGGFGEIRSLGLLGHGSQGGGLGDANLFLQVLVLMIAVQDTETDG